MDTGVNRNSFSTKSSLVVGSGYRPSYRWSDSAGLAGLGMQDDVLDASINFGDEISFSQRETLDKGSGHKSMVDIFLAPESERGGAENIFGASVVGMQVTEKGAKLSKLLAALCVIVVVLIIFITVPIDGFLWGSNSQEVSGSGSVPAPATPAPVTPAPTPSPTSTEPPATPKEEETPKETTTTTTSRQVPANRHQAIHAYILEKKVTVNTEAFDVQLSPHSQALEWLASEDTAELDIPEYPDNTHNVGTPDQQGIQLLQRYALACFFFTIEEAFVGRRRLGGDANANPTEEESNNRMQFDSTWTTGAASVCQWYGVTCNGQKHVTSLDLSHSLLVGRLVPEIVSQFALPAMTSLDLSYNQIGGQLPSYDDLPQANTVLEHVNLRQNHLESTVENLPHQLEALTFLDLTANKFFGTLPDDEDWALLDKLVTLKMAGNNLHGPLPPGMGALSNVEWFQLDGNALTGTIPTQWSTMTSLHTLKLAHNQIQGNLPGFLADLPLVHVSLQDNRIDGQVPSSFASLTTLEDMHLQMNHLAGAMPSQVCDLMENGSLEKLTADCKAPKVECSCCTVCY
ncbi:LRR receptor-like serine threonine-protein kinase [Seminavis robusta]|uniref:LRR receptor-like serine threonine-protein kinase n=1 Tax=Seminavis robusta TaxID=568900 RepID=A0A9N8DTF8_9STRA|nr:LRR receptor-like serine threonine-protein kinase [Seminavis robusta]|eukprot:Sro339_g121000.1 LRR receptor-like serine threonine-protein kinase (572) ;mRNA; r:14131-15969